MDDEEDDEEEKEEEKDSVVLKAADYIWGDHLLHMRIWGGKIVFCREEEEKAEAASETVSRLLSIYKNQVGAALLNGFNECWSEKALEGMLELMWAEDCEPPQLTAADFEGIDIGDIGSRVLAEIEELRKKATIVGN